ncbi:MAG TPA: hypothetical protein VF701_01955 [Thermoanaerobaculia bacterium]
MKRLVVAAIALFVCAEAGAASAVTGHVAFVTKRGQRPVVTETLVWLDPLDRPAPKSAGTFTMSTRGKMLQPHILAVPAGSTVNFPNEDPIAHNLFSLTSGYAFDLGLYRRGAGKQQKFEKPGIVNVYCNVHPKMSAVVHVMSTPYFGFAGVEGNYSIEVPPGRYRLSAWNEQGGAVSTEIVVRADGTVAGQTRLTIDGRAFRAVPHLNKDGKPYRAREY